MFNTLKRIKMARKKNTDKKTETAEVKTPIVDEKPVVETETETAPKVEEETPVEAASPEVAEAPASEEETKEETTEEKHEYTEQGELVIAAVEDGLVVIRSNVGMVKNLETGEIRDAWVVKRSSVNFYASVA